MCTSSQVVHYTEGGHLGSKYRLSRMCIVIRRVSMYYRYLYKQRTSNPQPVQRSKLVPRRRSKCKSEAKSWLVKDIPRPFIQATSYTETEADLFYALPSSTAALILAKNLAGQAASSTSLGIPFSRTCLIILCCSLAISSCPIGTVSRITASG